MELIIQESNTNTANTNIITGLTSIVCDFVDAYHCHRPLEIYLLQLILSYPLDTSYLFTVDIYQNVMKVSISHQF